MPCFYYFLDKCVEPNQDSHIFNFIDCFDNFLFVFFLQVVHSMLPPQNLLTNCIIKRTFVRVKYEGYGNLRKPYPSPELELSIKDIITISILAGAWHTNRTIFIDIICYFMSIKLFPVLVIQVITRFLVLHPLLIRVGKFTK